MVIQRLLGSVLFFICFSAFGAILDYEKDFTFEDLNYKYSSPDQTYISILPKKINPDASLVLLRTRPQVFFMVIAEKHDDSSLDMDMLESVVRANFKSAALDIYLDDTESYSVNGLKGRMFYGRASEGEQKFGYYFWLYSNGQYTYQVIMWSQLQNKATLDREFPKMLDGFSLISKVTEASAKSSVPLKGGKSRYGYSTKFRQSEWETWPELATEYPLADSGGAIANHTVFQIVPFCFGENKPHDDAITAALFKSIAIDYPSSDIVLRGETKFDDLTATKMEYDWKESDTHYNSLVYTAIGQNCAYMVAVWSLLSDAQLTDIATGLEKNIRLNDLKQSKANKLLDDKTATLYNYSGLYYYKVNNLLEALKYFELAQQTDPKTVTFLTNTLDILNQLKRHQSGLELVAQYGDAFPDNLTILSWKSWFNLQLNNDAEAIDAFLAAYNAGYRQDEELLSYIDLLIKTESFDLAEQSLRRFAEKPDDVNIQRKFAQIQQSKGEYAQALTILDNTQKNRPFLEDIVYDKIYIYEDMGLPKKMLELSQELIDRGHASAGAYFLKGKAQYQLGWYVQAKESLDQALLLSPNNQTVLSYLDEIAGLLGKGDASSVVQSIEPVALPKLPKVGKSHPDVDNYDSYYLLRAKSYEFFIGKALKATTYRTIKVLNANGVERFSTLEFDFDPWYERAYVNNLQVKDEQGQVVAEGKLHDYYVLDRNETEVSSGKTLYMPVPKLSAGYTIEYSVTTESLHPVDQFQFERHLFSSDRPVEISALSINGDVKTLDYQQIATDSPKKSRKSLVWVHKNPDVYEWEPMAVHFMEYLPTVLVNQEKQSWKSLGQEYLKDIDSKLAGDPEVVALVKKVTRNAKSVEDKVRLITEYVQENVTYKALEFGTRARIPNTPVATYHNRYGDCKDHAVLLYSMLNAAKIDSHLALVSVKSVVEEQMPSLNQFDHMIVYVPKVQNGLFLDTTDKNQRLINTVPMGLAKTKALVLADTPTIQEIPDYDRQKQRVVIERTIELTAGRQLTIEEDVTLSGNFGAGMRGHLKTIEQVKHLQWAQGFVANLNQHIEVTGFSVDNLYDRDQPLVMHFRYSMTADTESDAPTTLKDPSLWESYYLLPVAVQQRKSDFRVRYPVSVVSAVRYTTPPGYQIRSGGQTKSGANNQFGGYAVENALQGNTLTRTLTFEEPSGRYSSSQYPDFVKFVKGAVDAFNSGVQVHPL